jgi:hypothetical protein
MNEHETEPLGRPTTPAPRTEERAEPFPAAAAPRPERDTTLPWTASGTDENPVPGGRPAGSTVWSATTAPEPATASRGPRSGTLVLGLVLTLCGVAALAVALGFRLDLQLAVIVVLLLAAVTLLLVPLLQRARRDRDREADARTTTGG